MADANAIEEEEVGGGGGQQQQEHQQEHQQEEEQRSGRIRGSVHVVFGAECTRSFDWMSVALFHSFETSGWKQKNHHNNNITRLLACSSEQLKRYGPERLAIGPTFVHPNYKYKKGYGRYDGSPTYNKPASLMHFTKEVDIKEEFILFIDADMLLRRILDPLDFGAELGTVLSEYVWYIKAGNRAGMAQQFLPTPEMVQRASKTHGGYYHLFHVDDAKRVSPRWLYYTQQVRFHPEKYWAGMPGSNLTEHVDTFQKGAEYGDVPWISEMYGYSFAAAELGLNHRLTRGGGGVLYHDDFLTLNHEGPYLSHYTLSCQIPSDYSYVPKDRRVDDDQVYLFDKNHYRNFDIFNCSQSFFIPSPPPDSLVDEGGALCAENVHRINDAFCAFYRKHCSKSSNAFKASMIRCPLDVHRHFDHRQRFRSAACANKIGKKSCEETEQDSQECRTNPAFMTAHCLKSCGFCAFDQPLTTIDHDGGGGAEAAEVVFIDKADSDLCHQLAKDYECVLNPTWMIVNCRSTCHDEMKKKKLSNKQKQKNATTVFSIHSPTTIENPQLSSSSSSSSLLLLENINSRKSSGILLLCNAFGISCETALIMLILAFLIMMVMIVMNTSQRRTKLVNKKT